MINGYIYYPKEINCASLHLVIINMILSLCYLCILLIQVSEYLFRIPNKTVGFDLPSFDIARGRDFGIPSYNKFRKLCGLSEAKTFEDFTDQISKKVNTPKNCASHNNWITNDYSQNQNSLITTIELIINKIYFSRMSIPQLAYTRIQAMLTFTWVVCWKN